MSLKLMDKAFDIRVGNPLRKLILIKLADNASDQGECWPSYQHIANQCEISKRSVMAHIDALCEMGLIRKEHRSGPKGNSSNLYFLTLDGAGDSLGGSAAHSLPSAARSPDGAGDSLGGSAAHSLPSAARSPDGAGDSLGGSAGAAPRISNSFEPVNEPVSESLNTLGAQADASTPAKQAKGIYSPEFETAWQAYPKRTGGNPKNSAYKAWNARLREGASPDVMLEGVKRYAAFVTATGKAGSEYVKQAATFFGPDKHFNESWQVPSAPAGVRTISQHTGFGERDYGTTGTPTWARG